ATRRGGGTGPSSGLPAPPKGFKTPPLPRPSGAWENATCPWLGPSDLVGIPQRVDHPLPGGRHTAETPTGQAKEDLDAKVSNPGFVHCRRYKGTSQGGGLAASGDGAGSAEERRRAAGRVLLRVRRDRCRRHC